MVKLVKTALFSKTSNMVKPVYLLVYCCCTAVLPHFTSVVLLFYLILPLFYLILPLFYPVLPLFYLCLTHPGLCIWSHGGCGTLGLGPRANG